MSKQERLEQLLRLYDDAQLMKLSNAMHKMVEECPLQEAKDVLTLLDYYTEHNDPYQNINAVKVAEMLLAPKAHPKKMQ